MNCFTGESQSHKDGMISQSGLSPKAFRPRDDDITGLSVLRGPPYNTPETAAQGPSKRGYYLAVLRAGDLRSRGIEVAPRPVEGIAGHAEIISLTAANRDTNEAHEMMVLLAQELCLRVDGAFIRSSTT